MCGVRKLTRAAYANQRMTLARKLRQSIKSKRNTVIALRGSIHVACFHHSCFDNGVWRCLLADVVIGNTPLFFSARGIVASKMRKRRVDDDATVD